MQLGDLALFAHGHVLRVLVARWLDCLRAPDSTSCSIRAPCAYSAITATFPPSRFGTVP